MNSSHNQDDLKIPNYTLHLSSSIANPALGSVARVAVYSHKSITVKRRPDLEDPLLQLICLEAGLPGKSKSLYMVGYRQWQLAGQQDRISSTVPAQAERWDRLLTLWEAALGEGREVIVVMDANLDAMTWRKDPHSAQAQHQPHSHHPYRRPLQQNPANGCGDDDTHDTHLDPGRPAKLSGPCLHNCPKQAVGSVCSMDRNV